MLDNERSKMPANAADARKYRRAGPVGVIGTLIVWILSPAVASPPVPSSRSAPQGAPIAVPLASTRIRLMPSGAVEMLRRSSVNTMLVAASGGMNVGLILIGPTAG